MMRRKMKKPAERWRYGFLGARLTRTWYTRRRILIKKKMGIWAVAGLFWCGALMAYLELRRLRGALMGGRQLRGAAT
jgi:hypothetical protein